MAVVQEFLKLFEGAVTITSDSWTGSIKYRAVFRPSDIESLDAADVFTHPECPRLWSSTHPRNNYAVCSSIQPVRNAEIPHVVDLDVEYQVRANGLDSKGKPLDNNPTKHPLGVDWDTWTLTKPITEWRVWNGGNNFGPYEPAVNSAGERILGTEVHSYRQLNCSKFVTKADPIFAEGGDWVNSDTVVIEGHSFGRFTLLASKVNFKKAEVKNGAFLGREMSFVLQHNPRTWIMQVDNLGYHHICYIPVPGNNGKLDLSLGYQPIKPGIPPEITSQPLPLLNLPNRTQQINNTGPNQNQAQAAAFPFADYNHIPAWGPSAAPAGTEGAGVTNGDFYHGHVHPAFVRFNDKGEPVTATLTPQVIANIYAENRLWGLTRTLLSFNQYFPLK